MRVRKIFFLREKSILAIGVKGDCKRRSLVIRTCPITLSFSFLYRGAGVNHPLREMKLGGSSETAEDVFGFIAIRLNRMSNQLSSNEGRRHRVRNRKSSSDSWTNVKCFITGRYFLTTVILEYYEERRRR